MTAPATAPEPVEGSEAPYRQTNDDGSRFYYFTSPATGTEEQFWSVTTALSAKAKDGLKFWAAGLAAERAMDSIPAMVYAQRLDDCGNARSRSTAGCGQCPMCVQVSIERVHIGESSRRAIEGSAVHNALEWWIAWGSWLGAAEVANQDQKLIEAYPGSLAKALPPYLEQLARWAAEYAVEPLDFLASEMTVYNTAHRFAGTLDAILRLTVRNKKSARLVSRLLGRPVYAGDTVTVVMDCKSREGEAKKGEQSTKKLYDDHALQLAAYRSADLCMPSKVDRLIKKMIPTDGAVVLQIRPDGYSFEPVLSGPEELDGFLGFLKGFRWTVERGPASIAVKTFPVVGDGKGDFFLGERPADPPKFYDDADPAQALAEIYDGFSSVEAFAASSPFVRGNDTIDRLATEMDMLPGDLEVIRGSGACAACGRMDPKRRSSRCQGKVDPPCPLRAGVHTGIEVRSTVQAPPERAQAPVTRTTNATLASISRQRRPGEALTDADIPF